MENINKLKEAAREIAATEKGILWTDEEGKKHLLKIFFDFDYADDCSPRDWDNLASMIFWNRSYKLGDEHNFTDPIDFIQDLAEKNGVNLDSLTDEQKEKFSYLEDKIKDNIIIWPCWIYEHSEIAISCGAREYPFNDRFDSGFLGYIYTDKKTIIDNFGNCEDWKKKAAQIFKEEIKIYNQFLSGEVYAFREYIQEEEGADFEDLDSCYGFYEPSDVLEYIATLDSMKKNFKIVETEVSKVIIEKIKYNYI